MDPVNKWLKLPDVFVSSAKTGFAAGIITSFAIDTFQIGKPSQLFEKNSPISITKIALKILCALALIIAAAADIVLLPVRLLIADKKRLNLLVSTIAMPILAFTLPFGYLPQIDRERENKFMSSIPLLWETEPEASLKYLLATYPSASLVKPELIDLSANRKWNIVLDLLRQSPQYITITRESLETVQTYLIKHWDSSQVAKDLFLELLRLTNDFKTPLCEASNKNKWTTVLDLLKLRPSARTLDEECLTTIRNQLIRSWDSSQTVKDVFTELLALSSKDITFLNESLNRSISIAVSEKKAYERVVNRGHDYIYRDLLQQRKTTWHNYINAAEFINNIKSLPAFENFQLCIENAIKIGATNIVIALHKRYAFKFQEEHLDYIDIVGLPPNLKLTYYILKNLDKIGDYNSNPAISEERRLKLLNELIREDYEHLDDLDKTLYEDIFYKLQPLSSRILDDLHDLLAESELKRSNELLFADGAYERQKKLYEFLMIKAITCGNVFILKIILEDKNFKLDMNTFFKRRKPLLSIRNDKGFDGETYISTHNYSASDKSYTPLLLAIEANVNRPEIQEKMIELLMKNGATIYSPITTDRHPLGIPLLFYANYPPTAEKLISLGANPCDVALVLKSGEDYSFVRHVFLSQDWLDIWQHRFDTISSLFINMLETYCTADFIKKQDPDLLELLSEDDVPKEKVERQFKRMSEIRSEKLLLQFSEVSDFFDRALRASEVEVRALSDLTSRTIPRATYFKIAKTYMSSVAFELNIEEAYAEYFQRRKKAISDLQIVAGDVAKIVFEYEREKLALPEVIKSIEEDKAAEKEKHRQFVERMKREERVRLP